MKTSDQKPCKHICRSFFVVLHLSVTILLLFGISVIGDDKAEERTRAINRVAKEILNPFVSPSQLERDIRRAIEVDFPSDGATSSGRARQKGGATKVLPYYIYPRLLNKELQQALRRLSPNAKQDLKPIVMLLPWYNNIAEFWSLARARRYNLLTWNARDVDVTAEMEEEILNYVRRGGGLRTTAKLAGDLFPGIKPKLIKPKPDFIWSQSHPLLAGVREVAYDRWTSSIGVIEIDDNFTYPYEVLMSANGHPYYISFRYGKGRVLVGGGGQWYGNPYYLQKNGIRFTVNCDQWLIGAK